MREDMARVIVERPRHKPPKALKGGGRPRDLEDLPAHEGMRRSAALRGDRKTLNENLNPLKRYLARQVGRPWSKAYAEICAHLRVDSTVQQHVRDHLQDFVVLKPRRDVTRWSFRGSLWWQEFYVDPKTGLLCRTDRLPEEKARLRAKRQRPVRPLDRIKLADDRELRLIDGIWYEVQMAPMPKARYRVVQEIKRTPHGRYNRRYYTETEIDVRRLESPPVFDVALGRLIHVGPAVDDELSWKWYRRQQPEFRYAAAKRALSRRELRRHEIENQSDDAEGS